MPEGVQLPSSVEVPVEVVEKGVDVEVLVGVTTTNVAECFANRVEVTEKVTSHQDPGTIGFVYSSNKEVERRKLYRSVGNSNWLMMLTGDFNAIRDISEASNKPDGGSSSRDFNDWINACCLTDHTVYGD
ncbi:hypothetical protein LINPERHAP2_LOCUS38653 [Linum perenne]